MESSELVSIIIPCYYQAQYLEETVRSAVDQTYPNIEVIIVNDVALTISRKLHISLCSKPIINLSRQINEKRN